MELADLHTLLIVAREHSFSRAATLLNRTQPAISLAVRRLEQRSGVALFTRETKRPELTEAGRVLVSYAQQLCRVQDEARRALRRLRELRAGDLTLAIEEPWCTAVMPLVGRFREAHPQIRLSLLAASSRAAIERLARGELDFAVVEQPPSADRFEAAVLARDTFVVVVAAGHVLATRPSLGMADLSRETLIDIASDGQGAPRVAQGAGARATGRADLTLPSLDAVKGAIAANLGVAILPSTVVAASAGEGRLVGVPLADGSRRRGCAWIVRSRDCTPSIVATQFFQLAAGRGTVPDAASTGRPRTPRRVA